MASDSFSSVLFWAGKNEQKTMKIVKCTWLSLSIRTFCVKIFAEFSHRYSLIHFSIHSFKISVSVHAKIDETKRENSNFFLQNSKKKFFSLQRN